MNVWYTQCMWALPLTEAQQYSTLKSNEAIEVCDRIIFNFCKGLSQTTFHLDIFWWWCISQWIPPYFPTHTDPGYWPVEMQMEWWRCGGSILNWPHRVVMRLNNWTPLHWNHCPMPLCDLFPSSLSLSFLLHESWSSWTQSLGLLDVISALQHVTHDIWMY